MVAAGRFAPGHLGELTQLVPFEMVDDALERTGAVQSRVRLLPARVVVYLLLAGCLFAELGYGQVWHRLTAGLHGLAVPTPTASALRQARQRLGVAPMRALFDLLGGPAASTAAGAVSWRGLLVCAVDRTLMSVADSAANLTAVVKQRCNHGAGGYPTVRVLALVACGTRSVIDAVFGPASTGEPGYAARLAGSFRPGMLLLADRNFAAADLLTHLAGTVADLLVRCKSSRRLPVRSRHRDGTYLSPLGSLAVRVIEAEISIVTSAGRRTGTYRLVTTLLDPHRYPAGELITLYHQRWEIETVYLELKSTILGGQVLRAHTPAGIDQEIYALLLYPRLNISNFTTYSSDLGLLPVLVDHDGLPLLRAVAPLGEVHGRVRDVAGGTQAVGQNVPHLVLLGAARPVVALPSPPFPVGRHLPGSRLHAGHPRTGVGVRAQVQRPPRSAEGRSSPGRSGATRGSPPAAAVTACRQDVELAGCSSPPIRPPAGRPAAAAPSSAPPDIGSTGSGRHKWGCTTRGGSARSGELPVEIGQGVLGRVVGDVDGNTCVPNGSSMTSG
jgi:hypothetical protein